MGARLPLRLALRGGAGRAIGSQQALQAGRLRLLGSLAGAGSAAGVLSVNCSEAPGPDYFGKLRALLAAARQAVPGDVDAEGFLALLRSAIPQPPLDGDPLLALRVLKEELEQVQRLVGDQFGHLEFRDIHPLAVRYYFLEQCKLRTPTWKAAVEPGVISVLYPGWGADAAFFDDLLEQGRIVNALYEGEACVRETLGQIWNGAPWELSVCINEATPGRPAHLLAVRSPRGSAGDPGKVVLAVRGTQELADLRTGAVMDGAAFEGGLAHSGVVRAAIGLCDSYAGTLRDFEEKGYDVVVVGHSLGGAAAAAATIRLRNSCGLHRVRCVSFAPPVTVDGAHARECAPYVLSVVHDDDFVPRSQARSLTRLYRELAEYDWLPAARAELRGLLAEAPEWLKATLPCDELGATVEAALESRMAKWRERRRAPPGAADSEPAQLLHVPGFVLHLFRSEAPGGYSAARVAPERLERLQLSATMISDHLLESHVAVLRLLRDEVAAQAEADVRRAQELLPEGAEAAREAVAAGVRLAQKAGSKLATVLGSRPDTS